MPSMMNISWLHLLLQRPLVTILLFTLISSCILILLQIIASSPQDGSTHSVELNSLNNDNYIVSPDEGRDVDRYSMVAHYPERDPNDLATWVEDLKRIRLSVRNELKDLQREKTKILKEKASLTTKNEKILTLINKNKLQLKQLELDLLANRKQNWLKSCESDAVVPIVFNPLKSLDISSQNYGEKNQITVEDTSLINNKSGSYYFDLTLCPLTQNFQFNLASNREQLLSKLDGNNIDLAAVLLQALRAHPSYTSQGANPNVCMTVIILHDDSNLERLSGSRNNLVINLSGKPIDYRKHWDVMRDAFVASPSFEQGSFRHNIDVVIPHTIQPAEDLEAILGSTPLYSPLKRKYLASYFGQDVSTTSSGGKSNYLVQVHQVLQTIHRSSIDDMMLFIYNCGHQDNQECFSERARMIEISTFLIIIPDQNYDSDPETNDLIYLALSRGSIPVIFVSERTRLPFDEGIDWRLGSLLLPLARLPELHFILRSLGPSDLYSLKYHGRRIFERYLITSKQVADSIVSLISLNRLKYPPLPLKSTPTNTYFSSQSLVIDKNCSLPACMDSKAELMSNLLASESLGPRERPFKSDAFQRNHSLALTKTYNLWNEPLLSPSYLFPSHPLDPICPSEYKFLSLDQRFRPINEGLGGSGLEFSQSLGGDYPNEQFTIVLLTYERVPLLMRTLERLKGLAYLNKILIVWNGINQKPRTDLVWPDVGVPIVLVKVEKNSLNNRFLPYDAIETDAVFSMDDDSPLRPDEIVFAFRVWRESRDRIVGFPGRYHAWDSNQNSWMYNSNHSCELSMVLTGGAFFHKYYSFVYSQIMTNTIRTIVDKFMNCEDIAMNFLVAHLTRKPPIKVTSRWTFHCASCTTSLSEDNSHFMERHECLNIFTSIYGYMPLLSTQHRSDSILFKTRLPKDKQKCFKFV